MLGYPPVNIEEAHTTSDTVRLIRALLPEINDAIQHMEANRGWFPLKREFVDLIEDLEISNWAWLYLDEKRLKSVSLLSLIEPDEFVDISDPEQYRKYIKQEFTRLIEGTSSAPPADDKIEKSQLIFKLATDEEKRLFSNQVAMYTYGFIAALFNYLALLVHGRTMCQLVADAMAGDDEAYRKAVHIDRSVLYLPYFQKRMLQSQFGREEKFLRELCLGVQSPIIKNRVQNKKLWLMFAILENEGLLGLPQKQILDICMEAGVCDGEQGIENVRDLKQHLDAYRQQQGSSE